MTFYAFESIVPVVHPTAYIHPTAVIIGDVWIEKNCYIGPLCSLRGDFCRIRVMEGSNVQEGCILHGFPGHDVVLHKNSHIGHGAIVHTAVIEEDVLVGMNSVILDYAVVGKQSIIAANSTVPNNCQVPERVLFAGSPGKVKRSLNQENLNAKKLGTECYQKLAQRCLAGLKKTEPLHEDDLNRAKPYWDIAFDARFNLIKPK